MDFVLEMKRVTKRYPGTLAVDSVNFCLKRGEVHALMGENGAGKSSLMKMMSGAFDDYEGTIWVEGVEAKLHSPAVAKHYGIEMIHQELSNALPLTIAENLLAGNLPKKGCWIDKKKMRVETARFLKKVGLELDPDTALEQLSPHEQQLVEIAKALSNHPKILIMDEPTSSLSRTEVQTLFEIIDGLKKEGLAIVYISHHIPEVFRVADRVTVMRDGQWISTESIEGLGAERLVEMMVGKAMSKTTVTRKKEVGDVRFRFQNCSRIGFFHDVDFSMGEGEIVGIGGLAGSGRTEIARCIAGLDEWDAGIVYKDGEALSVSSMKEAIRAGIAYLSEDRKLEGLALDQESLFNVMASLLVKEKGNLSKAKRQALFSPLAKDLNIYPADPKRFVSQYSGGNQQKILLAKWMATHPDLLILDEPTRGVDIGAKQLIHEVIVRLADEGMSILLITSDLPELVELSNRILILRNGHIIGEMKSGFTEDSVLLAANGE